MTSQGQPDQGASYIEHARQVASARKAGGTPQGLPPAPASFIGRQYEITALDDLLGGATASGDRSQVAVSVITGSGGIGKTNLAIRWAQQNKNRFPDGQLFVDLRSHAPSDTPMPPAAAIRVLLMELGVAPKALPADQDAQAAMYRSLIVDKRMLIVLDNAATADQVTPLLPGTATCTVLITSRNQLPALIARHNARSLHLDVLTDTESRALLTAALGPDRAAAEEGGVAELIALCGGLPLALSLVAGRARVYPHKTLEYIAAELRQIGPDAPDFNVPGAGLHTVLSWSLSQLTDQQRTVFTLLGIAPVPDISLPAAASIVGLPPEQTEELLRELEQASLLNREAFSRYGMHDLIRMYATERTTSDVDPETRDTAARRLVDYYLHTAHSADRLLSSRKDVLNLGQPQQGSCPDPIADADEARKWFDTEHSCLIAILMKAMDSGRYTAVWQLALTMDTAQRRTGRVDDHLACWRVALKAAERLGEPTTVALARRILGDACSRIGLHEDGLSLNPWIGWLVDLRLG